MNSSSSSGAKIPRIHSDLTDSSNTDHIVIITELTEKYASLEKQLQIKENQLMEKDKYVRVVFFSTVESYRFEMLNTYYFQITEIKATHFTKEEEVRSLMIGKKKEYEKEVEGLHARIKTMQREIGTLNKRLLAKNGLGNGGGSGSQDDSAANSPASST